MHPKLRDGPLLFSGEMIVVALRKSHDLPVIRHDPLAKLTPPLASAGTKRIEELGAARSDLSKDGAVVA